MPAGRPRKKILISPERFATALAEKQCTNIEIASKLGISVDTLTRNYAEFLDKGRQSGKIKLRQAMFVSALVKGNVVAQIFLAKNILGMSDKTALELTGRDGGPVATTNLSALTNAELLQLESLVAKTATEPGVDKDGAGTA
jgi:hypothetical protein